MHFHLNDGGWLKINESIPSIRWLGWWKLRVHTYMWFRFHCHSDSLMRLAQKSKTVNKKVKDQKFDHRQLCASDFRIKQGFFMNQDDTNCDQIDAIQAGCSGVCLMGSQEASPWVQRSHARESPPLHLISKTNQFSCQHVSIMWANKKSRYKNSSKLLTLLCHQP